MDPTPPTLRIAVDFSITRMLALACILPGFGLAVAGRAPAADPPRVMIGYYASFGDLKIEQIPWHRLTHLCHAFLRTDDTGKIVADEKVPSKALTDAAHKNNVRVLLSLGGGRTTDGFEQVTADKNRLAKYVDQVVQQVIDNGYDGIDVDWEFPRDEATSRQFTQLIVALRKKLDNARSGQPEKASLLLTAAIGQSAYFGKHVDVERVIGQVDWFHVMTYDFAGTWSKVAAHHAPLIASRNDPERAWRSVQKTMKY